MKSQPMPSTLDVTWAVDHADRLDAAAGREVWRGGKAEGNQFPWCQLPPVVDDFVLGCGTRNLMRRDYRTEILELVSTGVTPLESLDLVDSLRLMTAHIRLDRFSEGHLAAALRRGELQAILRHLGSLQENPSLSDLGELRQR